MEIIAGELDWTHIDAEKWDAFLRSETGKRLIPKMIESAPALLATGDTNSILIRTGEFRGFQTAASRLLELAHSTPAAPMVMQNEYPPLEDDAAWNDGKKLLESAPEKKDETPL